MPSGIIVSSAADASNTHAPQSNSQPSGNPSASSNQSTSVAATEERCSSSPGDQGEKQPSSSISTSTTTTTSQSPDNNSNNKAPTRKITEAAKKLIREHFISVNWTRNKGLPKGKGAYAGNLQKIVDQFGLNRDQVRRQLNNYKKAKFVNSTIQLSLDADGIREKINEGILMTHSDFVNLKKKVCVRY